MPKPTLRSETSTTRGTIKVFLNQTTTAQNTTILKGNDLANGYKYIEIGQAVLSGVFSIQFELIFPTNTLGDAIDWMPRMVEIDYTILTKRF